MLKNIFFIYLNHKQLLNLQEYKNPKIYKYLELPILDI